MGVEITSVKALIYVDGLETSPRQLSCLHLEAIAREVEKLWPPDQARGIWFDVETLEKIHNYWHPSLLLVCYYLPDKSIKAIIPDNYLQSMLNRKIRIYPVLQPIPDTNPHLNFISFEQHFIEIEFVLE